MKTAPFLATLWTFLFTISGSAATNHFPAADLMRIGVYYYPEAWPSNQWARDMANIRKLNFEFVHMGEFAWAFMEPREGRFDFAWLDRNIELAAEQGLKVILCTPSPAPPVWLVKMHPEVLMVDAKGRRMQHGTRQQACWSVPRYRKYVGRIINELGRRYGKDPRVWGWQLDNELSHYGKEPCYCDVCQDKFRAWLKKKYGSIENLNRDWGNAFWSQRCQNFDQIRIPNREELVAQWNEHSVLDAQRWFAEEAADYLRFQTAILREYCGDRQWVTHNFMHAFDRVNPVLNAKDFEIMTWTIYPAHGNLNEGPLGFRLGGAAAMSFAHDFFRSMNGTQGIMELQPGQVNWGEVNPQPYPGAVHMWLMRAFAGGSKLVCTYRYRQPLFGAEQYHYGVVGTDGVTPSTGGEQYSQAAREIQMLRKHYQPDAKEPVAYAARRTALLYNFENRWDIDNHKQNVRWDTMGHIFKHYRALKRLGCPVDVITEDKDFSPYPFLVAPAYQLVDANLVQRWKEYAENGGHLVLTCRTGLKDRRGHLWEAPWAGPILDLIGAGISFYDTLPAPHTGKVAVGDRTYDWVTWADVLQPSEGTTPLATYKDQYYAGGIAAVTRKLGRGTVTYVGVDSVDGQFEADLIRGVFERAGVAVEQLADGFIVDWRDG
ncbi:MAG TPA: beta-galactosidase, partial [Verrucomicrobiota bacterium]|nr:beta-galactosidase [Verrucomicrobiota bacterium]